MLGSHTISRPVPGPRRRLSDPGARSADHFDDANGQPLAIDTHLHLLSEHVTCALAAGWQRAEMHEQVIDVRWIAIEASWAAHRDVPFSFVCVWRRGS